MNAPSQPDGTNCGVMIVAQAYSTVNGLGSFGITEKVSPKYVGIMRLRIMWLLLCYTKHNKSSVTDQDTHMTLAKHFGKQLHRIGDCMDSGHC